MTVETDFNWTPEQLEGIVRCEPDNCENNKLQTNHNVCLQHHFFFDHPRGIGFRVINNRNIQ